MKKLINPKCLMFGMMLAVWGFTQLVVLGFLFFFHATALSEDVKVDEEAFGEDIDINKFYEAVNAAYSQTAYNCWIAAILYGATFGGCYYKYRKMKREKELNDDPKVVIEEKT